MGFGDGRGTLSAAVGTPVTTPSGFPGITQQPTIYRLPSGGFATNFDPSTYKNALGNATPGAGIYYVSASGNSGNTGASTASPLTIDAALAKSDVVEIRFVPGEYLRTTAATPVTKSVNFIALGPGVYWTGWNANLTWSLTSGNIYQATRSSVQLVADGSTAVLDQFGQKAVYTYMGASNTPASIVVGPGQWATNVGATVVYVWPADNRVMTGTDTSIRLSMAISGTCLFVQGSVNVYAEGIDFEGGGSAASGRATVQISSSAGGNPTFTAVNCSARYSPDNGFGSTGAALINVVNCVANLNTNDGFGWHYSATYSATPTLLEIGCRAAQNGILNATSVGATTDNNNSFTYHDGIDGIRVNCVGDHSYGPIFADTGAGTISWNIGCYAEASKATTRGFGFHSLTNASMYLESCQSLSNPMAQYRVESSATITQSNCVAVGKLPWDNDGTGTYVNTYTGPVYLRGGIDERRRVDAVAVEIAVSQAYTLNGGTRNILYNAGSTVYISGSTASTTVNLPPNATANQILRIVNTATGAWTLSGNGFNVNGASSIVVTVGTSLIVEWTGSEWRTLSFTKGVADTGVQTFAGAGTISATAGPTVQKTAAGAYTLALPTSPTTGDTYYLIDAFGDALTFNLSVSSSDKGINATAAAGGAVTAVITGYGRAVIVYNGTKWILAKG